MNHDMISPLNRLMILTVGAIASWAALGGVVAGVSHLVRRLI
ncbi:hypothetical protein RN629_08325 [Sphingomonadaceae bacterium jetA1]|jgi:hypothetical protein